MAIFVAFAWVIEAAEWLGLIETEAQDADSRAYRLAHQGLSLLKSELGGRPLRVLTEDRISVLEDSGSRLLESCDGVLSIGQRGQEKVTLLDLGPGGGASFATRGTRSVDVKIAARTEDGGAYDVNLTLPIFCPNMS